MNELRVSSRPRVAVGACQVCEGHLSGDTLVYDHYSVLVIHIGMSEVRLCGRHGRELANMIKGARA